MTATANSFVSPQVPYSGFCTCTTADVAFNAPVNVQTLVDDATNTNGIILDKLYAITRATLAANLNCILYFKVGSTYTLMDSAVITTVTPSALVANGKIGFNVSPDEPVKLLAGVGLSAAIGTSIANGVDFVAMGGKY